MKGYATTGGLNVLRLVDATDAFRGVKGESRLIYLWLTVQAYLSATVWACRNISRGAVKS